MKNKIFILVFLFGPCLIGLRSQTVDPNAEDGRLFVRIADGSSVIFDDYDGVGDPSDADLVPFVSAYGLSSVYKPFEQFGEPRYQRIYVFEFTDISEVTDFINAIEALDYITYAEKIHLLSTSMVPNDPYYNNGNYHPQNWHLQKIGAQSAWNINTGSTNTIIAILDNEIDWQHPDLVPNIYVNASETFGIAGFDDDNNGAIDDFHGFDVADHDNDPSGTYILDHGTHCAGLASASSNNSTGISSIGYNCKILPVKICTSATTFNGPVQMIAAIAGVIYARKSGANVISCSWGTITQDPTLSAEIALAISNNIVVVAAAGNSNNTTPTYPANDVGVISVAATDLNDVKANFSNYGAWIDVSAPGKNIFSTNSRQIYNTVNGYSYKSGTSMACPIVAGLCGLILSQNPSLTPAQVQSCIQSTCTNINSIPANIPYAGLLGSGRINAPQAILCANNNQSAFFTADRTNACTNQTINLSGLSNATGITNWSWSFTPAPITLPGNTQNVSVQFANTTQVDVTLTVTASSGGPYTYTQTSYLNIGGPSANVVSPTPYSICNGSAQSLVIGFQNGIPPFTYTISNGYTNETFSSSSTLNPYVDYFYFLADPNHPNYTISSITDGAGCTSTNNSTVNLTIVPCCASLITNGDFEQGNTAFSSDNIILCPVPPNTDYEGAASVVDNNLTILPNISTSCSVNTNNAPPVNIRNAVYAVNCRKGPDELQPLHLQLAPLPFNTNPSPSSPHPGYTSRLWYQQNVNIAPFSLYNIDFHTIGSYGNSSPIYPYPMVLRLEIVNSSNVVILSTGDFVVPVNNWPDNDWYQFSYVWNSLANSGLVEVRISQVTYFGSAIYDIFFDDISMRKVNIPAGNGGAAAGQDIFICAGTPVQLSGSGGPSYSWAPISSTIAQPVVTPTTTTTYTLTTTNGACGTSTDQVTVYVTPYTCTSPNNVAASTFSGSTNFGLGSPTNLSVNGNIIFSGGLNTINCDDVRMGPAIKMTVKNGATLTITDAWLHGCSGCHTMWSGIEVEHGGTLIINNNSIIEDANTAVKTITSASANIPNLQISNTIFNKNNKAIYISVFSSLDFTPVAANIIKNCIFTCRTLPTTPNAANFNAIKNVLYNNIGTYPTVNTLIGRRSQAGIWVDITLSNANGYEIGVAGINTSAGAGNINVFDNMDFGINSTNPGHYLIRNNLFINLGGNSTLNNTNANPYSSYPFGVGISAVGADDRYIGIGGDASGATPDGLNTFKYCNRAMSLYGYNFAYIYNNIVENTITSPFSSFQTAGYYTGQYGLYMSPGGNSPSSNIQVINNSITNCAYGVHFNRSTGYLGTNYRIECNTITANATPAKYLKKGIYLQDAVGSITGMPLYGINVRFNTVTFAEEQVFLADNIKRGLDISCNKEWSVKYNAVPNSFPNTIDIIRLNNCIGVKVEANSLLKTSGANTLTANPGITGIYINNSSVNGSTNIINNNNINYVGSCIVWAGNNPTNTQFKGNIMQNSNTGLYMSTNAAFIVQGAMNVPMGNRWGTIASGSLINSTVNNSGLNINTNAQIYVKQFSGSGTLTGDPLTGHINISGGAYTIGTNPAINGLVETGGTEPTFIGCPSGCTTGGNGGGPSGNSTQPGTNTDENPPSLFDINRLAFDNTHSSFYDQERLWYNKNAAMKILIEDPNAIKTTDLNEFFYDVNNASIKSFGLVDKYIEEGNFEMAQKELHSIVPNNQIENNLYFVNQQIINQNMGLLDIENSQGILNQLFEIGNLCSFSSGPAVYKARSLYNAFVKGGYSFIENCPEQIAINTVTEHTALHSAYFNLYPNPNDGRMTIEYVLNENDNAELVIYDINGRIVWKKYIDPMVTTARIELEGLSDGVYMYKLVVNGEILESNKFIKVK